MIFINLFKVVVITLFFIVSTVQADEFDHVHLKGLVHLYSKGVIEASKKDNIDYLKPIITEKRGKKLFIWFKSWHENNYFMDARIKNIRFNSFDIKESTAEVVTDEIWDYRYIQIVTKEVSQPWTRVFYTIHYKFVKEGKSWKIDDALILSEKQTPLEKLRK